MRTRRASNRTSRAPNGRRTAKRTAVGSCRPPHPWSAARLRTHRVGGLDPSLDSLAARAHVLLFHSGRSRAAGAFSAAAFWRPFSGGGATVTAPTHAVASFEPAACCRPRSANLDRTTMMLRARQRGERRRRRACRRAERPSSWSPQSRDSIWAAVGLRADVDILETSSACCRRCYAPSNVTRLFDDLQSRITREDCSSGFA